ncbi:MAG: recombinase family protein [Solirubrobacterales bacterium]
MSSCGPSRVSSAILRPITATKQLRLDALVRVSRVDGRNGDSFRSPDQQRAAIKGWAEINGAEVVEWHEGLGRSGKTVHRADVDAALERIRTGQTDGVIVAWLDRFSRAPVREALGVYEDITAAGGKVVAVDMAGLNPADPTGEMALTVQLAVGRMQWRKTAERYEQTRREAIADGKAVGGAPFGYRFRDSTPKGRGYGVADSRLVADEDAAPIVRELFERKAGGATWLELARWLDTVAPKPNGGRWARSTVAGMIARRTYLGEVRHGPHVKPDAHEPIVTPALWRKAQNGPGRRTPRGTYLLSGLARCAGCGRRLRGSTLGRKPRKGRKASPPRIYTCATPECEARSTIVVDRLNAEVVRQFFDHLDAFHVRAVDDAELEVARSDVEQRTAEVEKLAAVVPSHPAAIAAHQEALEAAEQALVKGEDRLHDLTVSLTADGPDVRDLREDWPRLTLAERREILRAGIDTVLVRRAPSPTAKPPAAYRTLVFLRGEAPGGLIDNGRSGPVAAWTWDDDPASLTAAA